MANKKKAEKVVNPLYEKRLKYAYSLTGLGSGSWDTSPVFSTVEAVRGA